MMMKGKTAASGRPSTPSSGRRLSSFSANSNANMSSATGSLISNNQETVVPNHSRNYSTIYDQTRSSRYRTLSPQISSLNRDYHHPSPSSIPCSSSNSSASASASPSPMRRASAAQLSQRHSHSYRMSCRDIPQSYSRAMDSAGSRVVAGPNSATLGKISSGTLGSREKGQGRKNGQEIDGLQAGDEEEEEEKCAQMRSIALNRSSGSDKHESGANDVVESRLGKKMMSARASSSSCKVRGGARKGAGKGDLEEANNNQEEEEEEDVTTCTSTSSTTTTTRRLFSSMMNKYPSRFSSSSSSSSSSATTSTCTSTHQNFSIDCSTKKTKKNKEEEDSASSTCAGGNTNTTSDPSSFAAETSTTICYNDDDDDENNRNGGSSSSECCHGNYTAAAAAAAAGAGGAFLMLKKNKKKKNLESMQMMMKKSNMSCLAGLYNDGNTCYLNSCLQCLVHTLPLASAILLPCNHDVHEEEERAVLPGSLDMASTSSSSVSSRSGSNVLQGIRTRSLGLIGNAARKNEPPKKDRAHSLAREFQDLIRAMWSPSSTTISASKFLRRLQDWDAQFSGHHQQDAQEAMRAILDGLHESLNHASKPTYIDIYKEYASSTKDELAGITWQYYKSSNDSLIQDVFCGQLQSTIECSVCRRNSHCYDPFLDLSLPLPKEHACRFNNVNKLQVAIQDCLALFVAPETLSGDDKYKCATCKIPQCSTKKLSIYRAPPILVLHLKRFSGSSSSSFKKDNTPVSYPLKGLDLSEFLEASQGEQKSGVLYDLYAVCHHSGSIGYGHYTAQCKNIDGLWYSFNDSSVTRVDESCVVSPSAYILFYQLRL